MIKNITYRDLSLRHLRATYHVANSGSISTAATKLNRTQTAVTKSIGNLEKTLGLKLFSRTPSGSVPTVFGEAISKRVGSAMLEFKEAENAWLATSNTKIEHHSAPVFSMDIGTNRLIAFIRTCELKNINNAAAACGITRAAVSNTVREIEASLDASLFHRSSYGLEPTPLCQKILKHLKLALVHIRHALEDLAALTDASTGHLKIGTLPYTQTLLVPRTINQILDEHPEIEITTQEGTYAVLETALRCGDIDCIVGAIRDMQDQAELSTETLMIDNLAVVARVDHPLTLKKKISIADLKSLEWVLPAPNTPTRLLFEQTYRNHHLEPPAHFVESGSLVTIRGLLMESDRVALLSQHQVYFELQHNMLTILPVDLSETNRPIGITKRKNSMDSPAMEFFLIHLRTVAEDLQNDSMVSQDTQ